MSVYCVSYDLNKTGQNYTALYEELKKSSSWCHPLDSTCLIYTTERAEALSKRIGRHLDKNDRWLVIKVTAEYQGWLDQEVWDWIHKYVK